MSFSYSTFWSSIYHESIVEHDPRLRSICTNAPWINFDHIVDVDWVAANHYDRVASHPIAIYLNKLAPPSQKFKRLNKVVIYKRHQPACLPFAIDTEDFYCDPNGCFRGINGCIACYNITINPRNRWLKLYERNPRFTSTISALSTQLNRVIQARSRFIDDDPDEIIPRSILIPMDKFPKCYKVRIYYRQAWNPVTEGSSFMSIWKEPDPSASVDDVSGIALRHITLFCRDVICECNKCTMGCSSDISGQCDVCKLDHEVCAMRLNVFSVLVGHCGSFAEGCMLPTFFVWNELNEPIQKLSDIDVMIDSGRRVGFSAKFESNIFATIEMKNCKPGYLRLRVVENKIILRFSGIIDIIGISANIQNQIDIAVQICYKKSSLRGPATTNILINGDPDRDEVYFYSCSSWPPIAKTWIDRERRSKWPPEEIIQEIVSKGCRIVHKAHPSSTDPDAEFRFSFQWRNLFCSMRCLWTRRNVSLHSKLLLNIEFTDRKV